LSILSTRDATHKKHPKGVLFEIKKIKNSNEFGYAPIIIMLVLQGIVDSIDKGRNAQKTP